MYIKDNILTILEEQEITKYRLAKEIETQPIMVDNWFKGKVRSPQFKVCKNIYDKYGLVTFPFTQTELENGEL